MAEHQPRPIGNDVSPLTIAQIKGNIEDLYRIINSLETSVAGSSTVIQSSTVETAAVAPTSDVPVTYNDIQPVVTTDGEITDSDTGQGIVIDVDKYR